MSIPSSSEAVATSTLISPFFQFRFPRPGAACATGCRGARATVSSPMRSARLSASARPDRRVLTNTRVERCSLQQLRRCGRKSRPTFHCWQPAQAGAGISTARSSLRLCPTLTMTELGARCRQENAPPLRSASAWQRDQCERWAIVRASSRSSESVRCAPRLSSATAWISSTITVSTSRRISRLFSAVSRM